jgi:hypothetical protein
MLAAPCGVRRLGLTALEQAAEATARLGLVAAAASQRRAGSTATSDPSLMVVKVSHAVRTLTDLVPGMPKGLSKKWISPLTCENPVGTAELEPTTP